MIVAPALMLQAKADGFRVAARPPATNREPAATILRQRPTSTPPVFLPATGTAGLKLQVSRLMNFAGQFRPARYPAPGHKIRRASMTPDTRAANTVTQRAVMRQPAALINARPPWESYLYD